MRYLVFCLLLSTNPFVFCQSSLKKDIDNKYLDALYIKSDNTLTTEFQRFAIDLFKKGTKIEDSILKNDNYKVGITLIYKDEKHSRQDLEFTLYTLSYKDLRTKDFHKSIYFGRGKEGLSNFYVGYDNNEQKASIDEAVTSYLKHDSIPKSNHAYQFAKGYSIEDKYYEKFFTTDNHSTLVIGHSYAYLRQNGNYIIQIQGHPDRALDNNTEELYVTDFFVNDWYTISVFIIDDSNGKAYNKIFNYE
ncbi:hypothetical protein [Psychroserpens sp.]|uniref:hypothetical protein n=1 Tax=Psychroserpens sp. TaxID=2020870 RepID=UPI00385B7023